MDWSTIQDGIKDWFEGATGLTAYWMNQARPAYAPKALGVLQIISTSKVDVDAMDYNYSVTQPTNEEMVPSVSGYRLITVSCMVVSRDQNASQDAINYLELARTGLNRPSLNDALKAAGLTITWTSQSIVPRDVLVDNRYESRAVMDIIFRAVQFVEYTDTADTEDYIARTEVSSDLGGVDDPDVEWDNEIIGIPV
jgi:hypothetical protein